MTRCTLLRWRTFGTMSAYICSIYLWMRNIYLFHHFNIIHTPLHHFAIAPFRHHYFTIATYKHFTIDTISGFLHMILLLFIQVKCRNLFRITNLLTKVCYVSLKFLKWLRVRMWLKCLHGMWEISYPLRVSKFHPMHLSGEGWIRIIRI